MSSTPRLTYNAAVVLQALDRGYRYGFEIMEFTGLPSGTVYPILRRLETAGWLRSRWEKVDTAHDEGRPRRRYYELAEGGEEALEAARERFRLHREIFGDPVPLPEGSGER